MRDGLIWMQFRALAGGQAPSLGSPNPKLGACPPVVAQQLLALFLFEALDGGHERWNNLLLSAYDAG